MSAIVDFNFGVGVGLWGGLKVFCRDSISCQVFRPQFFRFRQSAFVKFKNWFIVVVFSLFNTFLGLTVNEVFIVSVNDFCFAMFLASCKKTGYK